MEFRRVLFRSRLAGARSNLPGWGRGVSWSGIRPRSHRANHDDLRSAPDSRLARMFEKGISGHSQTTFSVADDPSRTSGLALSWTVSLSPLRRKMLEFDCILED